MTINATDFSRKENIDLSTELAIVGVSETPFLSMLLAKSKTKATDVVVSRRVKTLSTVSPSGNKSEGYVATGSEKSSYTYVTNKLEIFSKNVQITGTAKALGSGVLAMEVQDRIVEIKQDLEKALLNNSPGGMTDRQMCGMLSTLNRPATINAVHLLTNTILNDAYAQMFSRGCTKEVIMLINPLDKALIDNVILVKERIMLNVTAGGVTVGLSVQKFFTPLGFEVSIMVTNSCPSGTLVLVDVSKCEIPVLRDLQSFPLAKIGDLEQEQIICEVSLIVAPQAIQAIMNIQPVVVVVP